MMMNRIRNVCSYFLMITLFILLIILSSLFVHAQSFLGSFPSFVNAPKIWNYTLSNEFYTSGFPFVSPILAEGTFICGLHCSREMDTCLFGTSFSHVSSDEYPQVVWSANRNNPVDSQALLKLTSEGELILKDANDTLVWSTLTAGSSVSRLSLSAEGNLMLLNKTNHIVWQSFDHPTDSLVRGQKLASRQKLRASVSPQNSSEGLYAFGIINGRFSAYMDSDPSQIYYKDYYNSSRYYAAEFQTQRFGDLYVTNSTKFIRLESDGHLRAYEWNLNDSMWDGVDILNLDRCSYPSACGSYGVCSEGVCNCPDVVNKSETVYFRPINMARIDLGCDAISPISCDLSHHHSFLQLPGEYFQGIYNFVFSDTIKVEDCEEACLKNCSCKAVIYRKGYCRFLSQVVSVDTRFRPGIMN